MTRKRRAARAAYSGGNAALAAPLSQTKIVKPGRLRRQIINQKTAVVVGIARLISAYTGILAEYAQAGSSESGLPLKANARAREPPQASW